MKERIRDFMTRQPWTVQADDSLAIAREMLEVRGCHHLPVLDAGEVVGMISARDLQAAGDRLGTASDLMQPAKCVDADAPLGDVLEKMTTEGSDGVVVVEGGRVAGIFTTSDALRVLAQLVRRHAE